MRRSIAATIRASVVLMALLTPCAWADSDQVKLTTTAGDIVIELFSEESPVSSKNFKQYVGSGFYDGTIFHRVIDGFMIQGGGYTTDYTKKETQEPISNEANNGLKNTRYTVALARTSAPHSATSQFFINTADNDFLDHTGMNERQWGYAVFGRVIAGHDVVDQIGSAATGSGGTFARDVPKEMVVIESATFVEEASAQAASEAEQAESASQ